MRRGVMRRVGDGVRARWLPLLLLAVPVPAEGAAPSAALPVLEAGWMGMQICDGRRPAGREPCGFSATDAAARHTLGVRRVHVASGMAATDLDPGRGGWAGGRDAVPFAEGVAVVPLILLPTQGRGGRRR